MSDVSPLIPAGRKVIETYGEMRFQISGTRYDHAVIVLPNTVILWSPCTWSEVTFETFEPLLGQNLADVLLIGCGRKAQLPSKNLRQSLRDAGMVIEPMDTGAACRSYNVLMAEDRRVAAALLPVA